MLTCASSDDIQRQPSNDSLNKNSLYIIHFHYFIISHGSHWGQSQLMGWTCPCQALQGTGSGEKGSKLAPTSVTHCHWASQSGKCCPSASWLAEGSKEVLLCVPSLVFWPTQMQAYTKSQWLLGSLNGPNRLILLRQRSFSKTTGENWLYVFFEHALITWVHWSCYVTLKALVLIFKTLKLLGGAHGRGPKPTTVFTKPGNCKENWWSLQSESFVHNSHKALVFSPRGLRKEGASVPSRKERTWEAFLSVHATPACYADWIV